MRYGFMLLVWAGTLNEAYGQTNSSTNTWTGVKVQKKLDHGFRLFLNPEIRTRNGSIDKYLLETGLSYKLNKNFSAVTIYRITSEPLDTGMHTYGRIGFDLKAKAKVNRFYPRLRVRYTNIVDGDQDEPTRYLRYRAGITYNVRKSKITPFGHLEAFQRLNGANLTKWRYSLGAEYKFNKKNMIQIGYRIDDFTNKEVIRHILNTSYTFKL
ncbi:MAG: DUF2490 domain-containing protein [Bacteroidia bacterium]|nr:DUF2490 domain-containing protein [Bacteroidia bacterium]